LAAVLVLLFHATLISKVYLNYDLMRGIFLFGYSGVDFFFVLSGFIIFWAHRSDMGRPAALRTYLRKRFIRIYPVYWIVAIILLPIYFGLPHQLTDCLVLLKSFLLLPQANNPVVTVAWSLSSELFFYGLFGLAIYLPWRRIRPIFIVWLLVTAVFYLAKLLSGGLLKLPPHTGFVFSSYNLEFAMGCLAAYLAGSFRYYAGPWLTVPGLALFLICGLSESFLQSHFRRQHSILTYGLASMLLVWGAVLWEQRRPRILPAYLLLIGDASYSIYLTHYALLDLSVRGSIALGIIEWIGPSAIIVIAIAIALSIGVVFYLLVEKPLLARLRKQSVSINPTSHRTPKSISEGISA
jgi:peptidoglycan/LPS O-acetylase OafA/YrhL